MKALREGRLVWFDARPDPGFWAEHWRAPLARGRRAIAEGAPPELRRAVSRWVPTGATSLDAGCGIGNVVWDLAGTGRRAIGVDTATEVLVAAKGLEPALWLVAADIRALPFRSGVLGSYVSEGVIEHFEDGYSQVLQEMDRVLAPGGILLVAFPAMSALRRLKTRIGAYPAGRFASAGAAFYQYALDSRVVERDLTLLGYEVLERRFYWGALGLADEAPGSLGRAFQALEGSRRSIVASLLRRIVDAVASSWAGYCARVVARKP